MTLITGLDAIVRRKILLLPGSEPWPSKFYLLTSLRAIQAVIIIIISASTSV
jgi:hypothetical protein